jgi:hypothetical protein
MNKLFTQYMWQYLPAAFIEVIPSTPLNHLVIASDNNKRARMNLRLVT